MVSAAAAPAAGIRPVALAAIVAALALAGCGPQTPVRGAQYYKAHPDEAATMNAKCEAGEASGSECDAAAQAIASAKADKTFEDATKMSTRKDTTKKAW